MKSGKLICVVWATIIFRVVVVASYGAVVGDAPVCPGIAVAFEALESTEKFSVEIIPGVGFYFANSNLDPLVGGPNVTRGMIIVPADGVSPTSYAPYARKVATQGYFVAILGKATPGNVLEAMLQHPELDYWSIAGHGTGGKLAARVAVTLQPRIKSLILIAAPLAPELDLRSANLYVIVIYGTNDTVNRPSDIEKSFSRLPGDAVVTKFPNLGYYDFAYSKCEGNNPYPADGNSSILTPAVADSLLSAFSYDIAILQWYSATPRGLSFGDNHFLTPGFNDSKPYPRSDVTVRFEQVPVPETSPQRYWWVFIPTEISGGLVYFSGAAVDARAYFPIAFAMAARGHLVVIPEAVSRNAFLILAEATSIIESKLDVLSGVPKDSWAVGGHSVGAVTAGVYAACHGDKVYGVVMHAGGWGLNTTMSEVPILQMFGSVDHVTGLPAEQYYITSFLNNFNPLKTTFVEVEGANHHQVGDYGYQLPDQIATIGADTQQDLYAEISVAFLDSQQRQTYASVASEETCGQILSG